MLKIGFAQIDITPEFGMQIPGYFNIRIGDGVIDPLYARAVALDDGVTPVAIVVLDIIHVSAKSVAMIRKRASALTGIPENNLLVAATHIHTGSSTDRTNDATVCVQENVQWTADKAADAIATAWNKRVDAKIGYGEREEYNVAFNRRYYMKDGTLKTNPGILNPNIVKPAAPIDPAVAVLRVDDANGKPIGAIVNHAVHPDVVGGTKYCADYIGELARTMKAVYGQDFGVVYLNGCCGDLNHVDAMGGTNLERGKQHIKMGRILGGDAIAIFETIAPSDKVTFGNANTVFHGTRRRPTEADVAWSNERLADPKCTVVDRSYARAMIDMFENPIPDPDIEVQSIALHFSEPLKNGAERGDVAICSLPGEIFVEIGLELKEKSPFAHTMIAELADGYWGYISTARGIDEGGYETRINKSTNMGRDTAAQLISNQLCNLESLKK